jgi:hypothetical protein
VHWRIKLPPLTGHFRHEPRFMIMNAELSDVKVSVPRTLNYTYKRWQTTFGSMKVCNCRLDHCNSYSTYETLTSLQNVEFSETSTFCHSPTPTQILVICRAGPCLLKQLREICQMEVILEFCYMSSKYVTNFDAPDAHFDY